MINLHFICPEGLNLHDLGGSRFESGFWNVSAARAAAAVGGRLFLHEKQKKPSWKGGTIESWHISESGKQVFVCREEGDQHVLKLEGWGQEQATDWRGGDVKHAIFWLTYKPLGPGSEAGWPRGKLTALVRDFERDPAGTTEWWRLAAHRQARVGDSVLLFKQGEEPRGIFGRGLIAGGPLQRPDASGGDGDKWRVEIRFTELVDPDTQLLLDFSDLADALALEPNNLVNTQGSGNSVPALIAARIMAQLDELATPLRALSEADADDGDAGAFDTEDQRERALRAICVRRGQATFRAALLDAYDGRCAITGCAIIAVLEAAHIVPYNGWATNHVSNGLLLRSDLHTLFDLGLLGIDPKTRRAVVAKELEGSSYAKLGGVKLRATTSPLHGPSTKTLRRRFATFGI